MKPLHRTAVLSCAVVVAQVLAAALLLRGGTGGPFYSIETAVTPTVDVAGLPPPVMNSPAVL